MQDTFIKLFFGIVLPLFKMTRLSSEQDTKVAQFYLQTGSVIETKRKYRSICGPKSTPSSRAIPSGPDSLRISSQLAQRQKSSEVGVDQSFLMTNWIAFDFLFGQKAIENWQNTRFCQFSTVPLVKRGSNVIGFEF